MSPTNSYSTSCTPNLGGVKEYYTKDEVNRLLASKAGVSTTYTRLHLDNRFGDIDNDLSALTSGKVDTLQLNSALEQLRGEIESDISDTYATLSDTYTKEQVDVLLSGIDINPSDYVVNNPTTTLQNTIYPGSNNAIALSVRGSSVNPIVTRWLDSSGDVIGYVSNNGTSTFEGRVTVGRLVSDGGVGLNTSGKRVTGVAVPVLGSDAVPLNYLQSYILQFYEEIMRPEPYPYYTFDSGEY